MENIKNNGDLQISYKNNISKQNLKQVLKEESKTLLKTPLDDGNRVLDEDTPGVSICA